MSARIAMKRERYRVLVGRRLKELRERIGMSQEQVALNAGCAVSTIGRLERGALNPTVDLIEELASAIEVSPQTILAIPEQSDSKNKAQTVKDRIIDQIASLVETADKRSLDSLSLIMDSLSHYRRKRK